MAFGQGRDRDTYPTEVGLAGKEAKRLTFDGLPFALVTTPSEPGDAR